MFFFLYQILIYMLFRFTTSVNFQNPTFQRDLISNEVQVQRRGVVAADLEAIVEVLEAVVGPMKILNEK